MTFSETGAAKYPQEQPENGLLKTGMMPVFKSSEWRGTAEVAVAKPARSALALGGNIGDSRTILEAAIETLAQTPGIFLESRSSWYRTKALGPPQPDYLNGCVILQVEMLPQQLLAALLEIEEQFGRVRQEHWGPRTLDLDLLLYHDLIVDTPKLQIPHPRMRERAFVLVPLAEIAPDWIEPISKCVIKELLKEVDCSDVHLT